MPKRREPPQTPNRPGQRWHDFSPKHITDHQTCPEQFFLRHIRKQRVRKSFARPLVLGHATHAAMAFIWNQKLAGFETPDDLPKLAALYLKRDQYPAEAQEEWSADVGLVAEHVGRCLDALDHDAAVVSVERVSRYALPGYLPDAPVRIQARVDLILKHRDGVVEHVDYKTGRHKRDLVQEVVSRVAVRAMLDEQGLIETPLVTTTLFADDGSRVSEQPSRDQFRTVWNDVTQTIAKVRSATVWRPNPGPYCRWCDFASEHCSIGGEKPDE